MFGKSREPAQLVPGNLTAHMFDVFGIKGPVDAICGFPDDSPEWITEEEAACRKANEPTTEEILAELEQDPDVQAVLEAFGHTAISKLVSPDQP